MNEQVWPLLTVTTSPGYPHAGLTRASWPVSEKPSPVPPSVLLSVPPSVPPSGGEGWRRREPRGRPARAP
ncbi:hypothetical protein [Thermocatellispora tengchongensis]|uniref:hypothetical protein n=1 Tax=Thermocatellispora tengchongensis TaxID=1073253 RepID=UPI00362F242D